MLTMFYKYIFLCFHETWRLFTMCLYVVEYHKQ